MIVPSAPFLLLSTRPEDHLAADERGSVARFLDVPAAQLHQVRLEAAPMPELDVTAYAGVILGGSPFTASTPKKDRSELQRRVEKELQQLFRALRAARVPFLGLCYGVGTFGRAMGGTVDATFAEDTAAVDLRVTAAGHADPILTGVPTHFQGFVGHKEALSALPPEAVLLVTGTHCPFQMWRLGPNHYVTQFHPEMDADSLVTRMEAYRYSGYFGPDEFEEIVATVRAADVAAAHLVLRNFRRLARADAAERRRAGIKPLTTTDVKRAAKDATKKAAKKKAKKEAKKKAKKPTSAVATGRGSAAP